MFCWLFGGRPSEATVSRPTVTVHNNSDRLRLVMLEPVGEDYWAKAGESCEIFAEGLEGDGSPFDVSIEDDAVSIWVERCLAVVEVRMNGVPVNCGHNRPEEWP